MKTLILGMLLMGGNALGQTVVVVQPDPYATAIVQLEVALALSKPQNRIDQVTIWTKCGFYTGIYVHYTDGNLVSTKYKEKEAPINYTQLNQLVATGYVVLVDADFGVPDCR